MFNQNMLAKSFASFKQRIRSLIRGYGWDLHRIAPSSLQHPFDPISLILAHAHINTVFDVGANSGQFARGLREAGYKGKIISFEPLSSVYDVLVQLASSDSLWTIHPRSAIGDYEGSIAINLSENSVSSSVLPMLESHISAAGDSLYIGSEITPISRLDSVAQAYLNHSSCLFIKIDTQGFERQVLNGAGQILAIAKGVMLELSLVPLYEGQSLWLELIQLMDQEGFQLWSIHEGFVDPRTSRTLQVDATFLRV